MSAVSDEFEHGMPAAAAAPVRVGLVDAYA
jgi:hypothetical protein